MGRSPPSLPTHRKDSMQNAEWKVVVIRARTQARDLRMSRWAWSAGGPSLRSPKMDGNVRILIADDQLAVRRAVGGLLDVEEDFEVVGEAGDGVEALQKVRELSPDVVLMDVSLPKLGGLEATKRITAEFPAVKIVGLSAHAAEYMAQPMLEAGATRYLDKNAPVKTLVVAIRAAVGEDVASWGKGESRVSVGESDRVAASPERMCSTFAS